MNQRLSMKLRFPILVPLVFLSLASFAKASEDGASPPILGLATAGNPSAGAEENLPVVEAYRRLLLEPTEEHLLDAATAAYTNAPDARTVEFLRRHLRVTEGAVLVLDGERYSDAELAYQCLDGNILDLTQIPGRRVKGIVSRWMGDGPFRLHLVEITAEDAARCEALAQTWLEGYRAGLAGETPEAGATERANWMRGYYVGKKAQVAPVIERGN